MELENRLAEMWWEGDEDPAPPVLQCYLRLVQWSPKGSYLLTAFCIKGFQDPECR